MAKVEFKSSQTFHKEYMTSLNKVYQFANSPQYKEKLVYADDASLENKSGVVQGWRDFVMNL